MNATDDKLANALGIDYPSEPKQQHVIVVDDDDVVIPTTSMVVREEPQNDPDVEEDYNFARGNIYNLIEKGNQAVNGILNVAHEGQSPRAYEVAANLIKTLGDMSDKLLAIQKTKKELKPQNPNGNNNGAGTTHVKVDKAVFVGTTSELLDMVKEEQKQNAIQKLPE